MCSHPSWKSSTRVIKAEVKCCILDLGFILRQGLWQFCFYPLKVSESVRVSLQTYIDRMEGELNSSCWLEMSSWWGFLRGTLDVCLRQNAGWPLGRTVDQNSGMGLSLVQPFPRPWLSSRCGASKGKETWGMKMKYWDMLKIGSFLPESSS